MYVITDYCGFGNNFKETLYLNIVALLDYFLR